LQVTLDDQWVASTEKAINGLVAAVSQQKKFVNSKDVLDAVNRLDLSILAEAAFPVAWDEFQGTARTMDLQNRLMTLYKQLQNGCAGMDWGAHGTEEMDQRVAVALSLLPTGVHAELICMLD
jgi:hypothetical protein